MKTTFSKQLILLAALLLAGVNSASAQFVRGDVNGDGAIDITDVTSLVEYIHHGTFPKAPRTITFATPTSVDKTFGDANFTNTATASAGADDGALTYSSSNTDVATVDASTGEVTIAGVGTTTITASITVGTNYSAASELYTLTVTAAPISPTVSLDGWTYGTPSEPTVSGNTGNGTVTYYYKVKDADDETYATTKPTTVGNYTVKASIAATANYQAAETAPVDFAIEQKEITVTGGITADNKVYDGTTTATLVLTGATFDGVVSGDNVTVASATGAFASADVATGVTVNISDITLGGTDVANYKLATTGNQATTTADITAANFTPFVTLAGWTYGSPNTPSVGDTNTSGGTVTYYYKTGDAEWTTTQPTDVGTHQVKASIAASGNYGAVESAPVDFTITAATISNVAIAELSAPETGTTLDTEASCSTTGIESVGTVTWKTGGEDATGTAAANTVYTASVTLTANSNYVFADTPTADAISGKTASVTCTDDTHITVSYTFDATAKNDLSLTLSLTGWTYGETANTTPTLLGNAGNGAVTYQYKLTSAEDNTYTTFDADNYPTNIGDYTLKATVAASGDYNEGSATTTFSITKAVCTVSLDKTVLTVTGSSTTGTITVTRDGDGTVTAESSNTSVATVSVDGTTVTVTGVATGTATITIKVNEGTNHQAYTAADKTVTVTASGIGYTTLAELKNAVNSSEAYSSYIGWEVNSDGGIAASSVSGTKIGYIAYISTSDVDADVSGSRILVIGSTDASTGVAWGGSGTNSAIEVNYTELTGTSLMNGYTCTKRLYEIDNGVTYTAAKAAWEYDSSKKGSAVITGSSCWFMPSYNQWWAIMGAGGIGKNKNDRSKTGMTTSRSYWSSTESNNSNACCLTTYGSMLYNYKYAIFYVRAVFAY